MNPRKEARLARAFLIGNGSLTATGDRHGALLEIYAPHVSPDSQLLRRPARIGLALDGIVRWLPEGFDARPGEASAAPIADLSLAAPDLGLEIWVESYVDATRPIVVRRVQATNRGALHRTLTLYFHHDLRLAAGRPHESARRDVGSGGLLHASGRRAALFNLEGPDGAGVPLARTVARAEENRPGADAEALQGGAEPRSDAAGYADSVGGVALALAPGEAALVTAWLAIGATPEEARALDAEFRRDGAGASRVRTRNRWNAWSREGARDFPDLPDLVGTVFASSLLALRLHQTPSGAIVSGVEAEERDAAWCRLADAAPAADALGRAGYRGAARRYFSFVAEAARRAGRLAAAYEPSGEAVTLPGEPDISLLGAALHLRAAARHAERDRDVEFLASMWEPLLVPIAERLAGSLDARDGLPRSVDWWGERIGVHATVASATCGALRGAARLAAEIGERERARAWAAAGDRVARAAAAAFGTGPGGPFRREPRDDRADASLLLLGLLDDFEPEDPRVRATVAEIRERLWIRTGTGGLARYEGDSVGSVGGGAAERGDIPGSPNVAATLWLALHEARAARRVQELEPARTLLFWAAARAEGNGLLPERLHPYRGRTTGAVPSLRAHTWFVEAALDYSERARLLTRCERCGEPAPARLGRSRPADARPADARPVASERAPGATLPPGLVADL